MGQTRIRHADYDLLSRNSHVDEFRLDKYVVPDIRIWFRKAVLDFFDKLPAVENFCELLPFRPNMRGGREITLINFTSMHFFHEKSVAIFPRTLSYSWLNFLHNLSSSKS